MKYPWRTKKFYPVSWAAQSVKYENSKITLPMGRGRKSLVFKVSLDYVPGACSLVWNRGFELHVKQEVILALIDSESNDRQQLTAAFPHIPSKQDWDDWLSGWTSCGFSLSSQPLLINTF